MRTATLTILTLFVAALSVPSFAHDPKEHQQQGATAPDCSRMTGTDAGKMDMNDPVVKALHAKCKKQMEQQHMRNSPGMGRKMAPSSASPSREPGDSAMDCTKMKGMDMSKMDMGSMDMSDPAMKAMHDKCMKHMRDGAHRRDAAHESGPDHKPTPTLPNESPK